MGIITKRVTMTDKAWKLVREVLEDEERHCNWTMQAQQIDVSDAITALAEAEVMGVSETYSERK